MKRGIKLVISMVLVAMLLYTTGGLKVEAAHRHHYIWGDDGNNKCIMKCMGCGDILDTKEHNYKWKHDDSYHWQVCDRCDHETAHVYHDGFNLSKGPNSRTSASHSGSCSTCAHVFTNAPHVAQDGYRKSSQVHEQFCRYCNWNMKTEEHFSTATQWSTNEKGHYKTCDICGAEFGAEHVPSSTWDYDEKVHYRVCTICHENFNKIEHNYVNGKCICGRLKDSENVSTYCDKGCTKWRYTYGTAYYCGQTCVGGHKTWYTQPHSGTPNSKEIQTCTKCEHTYHLHNYVNGMCTLCYEIDPSQSNTAPTSILTPTPTSTPTPQIISEPTGISSPIAVPISTEKWEKDVYYHWQVSGKEIIKKELHKPIPATCTEPISCICGAYVGKPAGHEYINGICRKCGVSKGSEASTPVQKNVPFDDVNPGDWYYENGSVKFVTDRGYIEGLSSNKFGPDVDMTRGNFIKMLYIIEGEPKVSQTDILEIYKEFSDITDENRNDKENKLLNAIIWGRKNNIMNGLGNGEFGTDKGISRQQMAVALKRYVEYRGENTSKRADLTKFSDYKDVYDWAEDAFKWAVASGIISGSGNNLNPQANATRAQVATMIMNYLTK